MCAVTDMWFQRLINHPKQRSARPQFKREVRLVTSTFVVRNVLDRPGEHSRALAAECSCNSYLYDEAPPFALQERLMPGRAS